ncbi:hypothetical protein Maqu_3264 [Marinobacter nauticus VT8]|uniref:Uncharacterized protein n=2 Tax=Marinobacter nauticus TaxID=2743 RepID=A1U5R6_MARN8|nr:hypothetical protein Maqu_3264 [Marinobacter nauticus VT8]
MQLIHLGAYVSGMSKAIQAVEIRCCWSCEELPVELLELSFKEPSGFCRPFRYEVRIPGEEPLYQSESEYAARRYLEMLLALPAGHL